MRALELGISTRRHGDEKQRYESKKIVIEYYILVVISIICKRSGVQYLFMFLFLYH